MSPLPQVVGRLRFLLRGARLRCYWWCQQLEVEDVESRLRMNNRNCWCLTEDFRDAVWMSKCCEMLGGWDQSPLSFWDGQQSLMRRIRKGMSVQWGFAWVTALVVVTWGSWTSVFVFNRPPWVLFWLYFRMEIHTPFKILNAGKNYILPGDAFNFLWTFPVVQ